jgi:hypothetical protein
MSLGKVMSRTPKKLEKVMEIRECIFQDITNDLMQNLIVD